MKTLKHGFFYLLLLTTPFLESGAATHVCDKDVVTLPLEVKLKSPQLDYVGKAADGRPVFYQPQSEVVYVFEKDFKKQPQMIHWDSHTDNRDNNLDCNYNPPPINHTYGDGWYACTWSQLHSWGITSFLNSMHIACGSVSLNSKSPNKDLTKTNPSGCIAYDKELNHSVMARCCDKLEFNPNNMKCDEPALVDTQLKACSDHNDCSDNKGCFPQRTKDLFITEDAEPLAEIVQAQSDDWAEDNAVKSENQSCNHAKECSTYSCVNKKCSTPRICRLADKNEYAQPGIHCVDGLEKDAAGKCVPGPGYTPYVGMLQDIQFEKDGQCGFTMDKDQVEVIANAMKTIRAMEWLLTRVSPGDPGDCFKMVPHLREKIAKRLHEVRTTILPHYNHEIKYIEQDYNQVLEAAKALAAKKIDDNPIVDPIHGTTTNPDGTPITNRDLATRQTGGYDTLMIMYRRNALFQSYEQAMLDVVNEITPIMKDLVESMGGWADGDEAWNLGSGVITGKFNCDAKYEKWKFWKQKWVDRHHDSTHKRWETFYDVRMDQGGNKAIVDRELLQTHLATIYNKDVTDVMPRFYESHALLDPLNYRATTDSMKFNNFGDKMDLNREKGFWEKVGEYYVRTVVAIYTLGLSEIFGLFKSTRETRYARKLNGSNHGTYQSIYDAYKEDIKEYYKGLMPAATPDEDKKIYVYEPEIVGLEGKACATNPTDPKCDKHNKWVEQMTDMAFAQYMMYSYMDNASYANYFRNPKRGRPMLFARYTTDLNNLSKYYLAIIEKRSVQNACIQALIDNVENNFDNDDGSGIDLTAGSYGGKKDPNKSGDGLKGNKSGGGKYQRTDLKPFHIDLLSGKPMDFNSSQFDSIARSFKGAGEAADVNGGASITAAAIRDRTAKMNATNERAKKKGIDVDAAENSFAKNLGLKKKVNGGSIAAGAAGNGHGNGHGNGNGGSGHRATLDADANANGNGGKDSNPMGALGNGQGGNGAGGKGQGGPGGFSSDLAGGGGDMSGSGGGMNGGNGMNGKDGTGMSDEEKDVMMANYDRNKGKYNPNEDDGLFGIVSKAYVRNLDKVLIRKKRIDD